MNCLLPAKSRNDWKGVRCASVRLVATKLLCLLLFWTSIGFGQSDLAIQSGFGDGLVSKFAFDDSGQYLAAVVQKSNSRTVTLWEVSTER